ncbi:MAG: hypothetical protein EOO65_01890 [Methanosarcinales archaeon]|nr:MAG: hypothetical protein EOO65_01890 [Methanosarcinales archaeon]
MQRAYEEYPPPKSTPGKLEKTLRKTFVNRYTELATMLDVHLANKKKGNEDMVKQVVVVAVQSPGCGKTMFGKRIIDGIFNRPPEQGAERKRVIKLLQDAKLESLSSCPWAEVEADTDTNVLVAAFSRVYKLKGVEATFTALRAAKPVYVKLDSEMNAGKAAIVSRMLSALGVSAESAAKLAKRKDGLRLTLRALTNDGARGCVLVIDEFYEYVQKRDERYKALRSVIVDALDAGAMVYVAGASTYQAAEWLAGESGGKGTLFFKRPLLLTALKPEDIVEIVAAVFRDHPDLAKEVITRRHNMRAPTAEEVATAAQALGRVIYQVTGGHGRTVENAITKLFDSTGSWCLEDPGTTAKFIFSELSDDSSSLSRDLSLQIHLTMCLGGVEPSKNLVDAFRRHLFDLLVLGALVDATTDVEAISLKLLLLGFRVPYTLSCGYISMFAGDLVMHEFMKVGSQEWSASVAKLKRVASRPTERGSVAEEVVLYWLKSLAGTERARAGGFEPVQLTSMLPLLVCVAELAGAMCTPDSFELAKGLNQGHDLRAPLTGAEAKLVLQCKSFSWTRRASQLTPGLLNSEIAKEAALQTTAAEGKHIVLVIVCSRLADGLQRVAGSDACILLKSGAYDFAGQVDRAIVAGYTSLSYATPAANPLGGTVYVPPGMTVVVLNPLHAAAFPLFTGISCALFGGLVAEEPGDEVAEGSDMVPRATS